MTSLPNGDVTRSSDQFSQSMNKSSPKESWGAEPAVSAGGVACASPEGRTGEQSVSGPSPEGVAGDQPELNEEELISKWRKLLGPEQQILVSKIRISEMTIFRILQNVPMCVF